MATWNESICVWTPPCGDTLITQIKNKRKQDNQFYNNQNLPCEQSRLIANSLQVNGHAYRDE